MGILDWNPKDLLRESIARGHRVSEKTIRRILNDENTTIESLEKITATLDITMYEFFAVGEPKLKKSIADVPLDVPAVAQSAIQRVSERGDHPK